MGDDVGEGRHAVHVGGVEEVFGVVEQPLAAVLQLQLVAVEAIEARTLLQTPGLFGGGAASLAGVAGRLFRQGEVDGGAASEVAHGPDAAVVAGDDAMGDGQADTASRELLG